MSVNTVTVLHTIVENWTGLLDFYLELNSAAFDWTNYTVRLLLSKNGVEVVAGGTLTPRAQSGVNLGWGDYAPVQGDFQHSHKDWETEFYEVRFEVSDSAGRVEYFPNDRRDRIHVNRL
jgi:hypothetical protein